jgi:hypothetical protein
LTLLHGFTNVHPLSCRSSVSVSPGDSATSGLWRASCYGRRVRGSTGRLAARPGCKRKYPIGLNLGDFSNRVYAVTRARVVKSNDDGTAAMAATERHDVTDHVREFIRRNPEWVCEQMPDAAVASHAG